MVRELVSRCFGALLALLGVGGLVVIVYMGVFSGGGFEWRHLGGAVVAVVVVLMGLGRLFPSHYAPIPIDHDDPAMKRAIDEARQTLARFKQGVQDGRKQPFVKFPLKSPNGETEHIWGVVHALEGDVARLSLANEAVHSQGERDPRFSVALSDIEDWILIDAHGVSEGGYTHLAMARMYKKQKGYLPRAMRKQLASFKDLDLDELQ